jgi:hypothetical protein
MRGSQFRFESESRPSRCRSRLEGDYVQSIDLNHNVVFNDYGAILWPAWPIRPFWPPLMYLSAAFVLFYLFWPL